MANKNDFQDLVVTQTVTIANGGATSTAADLRGTTATVFYVPAEFEGTQITFQVSYDNSTFSQLIDADGGAAIVASVAAGKATPLDPGVLCGAQYLKVVSNNAVAADRTITISARQYL